MKLPFDRGFFPVWEGEDGWRESLFQLCGRQHGGSKLGATLSPALEITTTDRDWLLERVGQQR